TAKVKNLYALEEALDWVESPKWSPKFPAPRDVAEGARAFATYCQRCHAQPYLDKFSAQWDAAGENWRGTNAPSDLTDHFVAENYLGQTRYVWRVTKVGFESVGTDDQFIKVHAGRYTLNPRATDILDGEMRDGILATLREKVGDVPSSLAARLAELEGRDITLTGQAIVNAQFDKLKAAQLTPTNPLRKPDGSVMTLMLLAGSTASAVDSYFLDAYSDRETAAKARDTFSFMRHGRSPLRWRRWPSTGLARSTASRLPRRTDMPACGRRSSPSSSPTSDPRVSGWATASSIPSRWASTSRREQRFAGRRTAPPRASG